MASFPPIQLSVGDPRAFLRNIQQEIKEKWKGQAHFYNDVLTVKSEVWDGTLRSVFVDEGLAITFLDINVKQPCQVFHDLNDEEYYYHFYFDTALGQRRHGDDTYDIPIGLAEKYSFVVMSSNTTSHTDISVCQIHNVLLHISRRFFYENVPLNRLLVDSASWRRLFGLRPLILYGTCNDKILKVVDDLSRLDLPDYSLPIYMKGSVLQLISQTLQVEIERSKGELMGISNPKDVRALLDLNFKIEQNFDEPLPTIEEVAAEVHMSATKFKELFKKIFGTSYYTFYKQRRMDKARELLLSKKYSVVEVAAMIGFLSSGKFSKQFKAIYDVLPKDILKMRGEEIDRNQVDVAMRNKHIQISYH